MIRIESVAHTTMGSGASNTIAEPNALAKSKVGLLALIVLGIGSLLTVRPRPRIEAAGDQQLAVELYAGNLSCVGCHGRESARFGETAHARALFRAESGETAQRLVGRTSPDANEGEIDGGRIEYRWDGGRLWAANLAEPNVPPVPIDWCFGSGELGMTFGTLLEDRFGRSRLLEHRWSWFRDGDRLALTPGHAASAGARDYELFGEIKDASTTRQCFACHATAFRFQAGRIDEATIVPGVQCERCHGPRKEHVRIKMQSQVLTSDRSPTRAGARQQVYACGECHRRPDEINDEIRPDNPVIARFAPVGLVRSKCFLATESKGTLTCTTCHDPHGPDRPMLGFYDDRCHNCHDPRRDSGNVSCSIDPGDRSCVGCHMPKVQLHEHLQFTDHWIRGAQVGSTSGIGD